MERSLPLVLLVAVALAGCNSQNLRYKADPQPAWANLYADYTLLQDGVAIVIDTDSRRLEDVFVTKPDGSTVRATRIDYPGFGQRASIGTGVGVGAGPVGVGVGTGIPVGPARPLGPTSAIFAKDLLGPEPWVVHVKVEGVNPTVIRVGGPANAR